jgi:hypothetical protein
VSVRGGEQPFDPVTRLKQHGGCGGKDRRGAWRAVRTSVVNSGREKVSASPSKAERIHVGFDPLELAAENIRNASRGQSGRAGGNARPRAPIRRSRASAHPPHSC